MKTVDIVENKGKRDDYDYKTDHKIMCGCENMQTGECWGDTECAGFPICLFTDLQIFIN